MVFQVLQKINLWNFSDFLYEVTVTEKHKIDSNDFVGKNLSLAVAYPEICLL